MLRPIPLSPGGHIRLVQLSVDAMTALLDGDLARARELTGLPLGDFFVTGRARGLWAMRLGQIAADPAAARWVARAVATRDGGSVVGHAGFHGPPDADGMVEVGYAVVPEHRRLGYATAMLARLLAIAAEDPAVRVVRASVGPDNVASLATIAHFGFVQIGQQWDDEDGLELVFERPVTPAGVSPPAR